MKNKDVQEIAKMTIQYAKEIIKPGMSLVDLRNDLEKKMLELGADSFWYWDVGAFIFSGDETNVSISGKHYVTANKTIQNNDIITIDLSPQNNNVWGDYARTIIIENGIVVDCVGNIENEEWKKGLQMEDRLHQELLKYVTVETTFEDLYFHMNHLIKEYGFINLDFLGNLGHSIVNRSEDRIYIEKGNKTKLIDVNYFTFEPHISVLNSKYGYKKENIYYYSLSTGAEGEHQLSVISQDASVACRINKCANEQLILYANNRWDYPEIAWGNYCKTLEVLPCYGRIDIRVR